MKQSDRLDYASQFLIPLFTIGGYALTGFKHPEWGLIISLIGQPFWFYSSYKAYKEAGQSGLLITSIIVTFMILLGIINYWFL
ncbi:MAG: hypothetical protein PHX30_03730 [Candidatus Pacebacteria bacterium]|jgi:hypothetical protein|nr:hypothetical protein [Candidatus Paceibacterota bacterium]